mgnify:CR=1 FL=1
MKKRNFHHSNSLTRKHNHVMTVRRTFSSIDDYDDDVDADLVDYVGETEGDDDDDSKKYALVVDEDSRGYQYS